MSRIKSLTVFALAGIAGLVTAILLSGRPGALRRRAPLGTGLASFPASGSSKP